MTAFRPRQCGQEWQVRSGRSDVAVSMSSVAEAYLVGVRPDDLAALVVGELVRRNELDRAGELGAIDEIILGAANQAGEDNRNVARMSVLLAGLPDEVPGITVNRLCASGMSAITMAAHAIRAGDADLIIAGGVEYRRLGKHIDDYDHVRQLPEVRVVVRRPGTAEKT